MNTEQKILKLISENKGKARAHTVAKHLKLGNSYVEYLYEQLLKKGLIIKLKEKGWYKITRKGRKEIGEKIKPSKKISKRKKITKKGKKKKYKRMNYPSPVSKKLGRGIPSAFADRSRLRPTKVGQVLLSAPSPTTERRGIVAAEIKKQRPKKRKKIRKPKAKSRGRGQIFKKAKRKSEPKIEKEKKEQLESLTLPKTEAKEKEKKTGIIEVFKKLFTKPPERAK